MFRTLLAAGALGAVMAPPTLAQTGDPGPLSPEDVRELEGIFAGAGFTGFCEVTDPQAFPAAQGAQAYGVTTVEGRTLYIMTEEGTGGAPTGAVPSCEGAGATDGGVGAADATGAGVTGTTTVTGTTSLDGADIGATGAAVTNSLVGDTGSGSLIDSATDIDVPELPDVDTSIGATDSLLDDTTATDLPNTTGIETDIGDLDVGATDDLVDDPGLGTPDLDTGIGIDDSGIGVANDLVEDGLGTTDLETGVGTTNTDLGAGTTNMGLGAGTTDLSTGLGEN